MTTPRSLLLCLAFAAVIGGLAAQRPAAPAETAPAAEEVYTPEPVVAPGPARPADKKSAAPAPVTPPLSPRFQQVRNRIDVLFHHRNEAAPAADPRKNPFRPAGAAPVVVAPVASRSGAAVVAPPPAASNADLLLLQQGVATLKVAGTIQINGLAHLVINQVPYKEGDVLSVRVKGQPVFLRVKNISRYSYTLSLNAAELSVKY